MRGLVRVMNKRSRCIDEDTFKLIVSMIRAGYTNNDGVVRQLNERFATVLTIEYNLGIRIGDVLELHMCNLVKDGKVIKNYSISIICV